MFNHIAHYISSILHMVIVAWFGGVFFSRRRLGIGRAVIGYIVLPVAFPLFNSLGYLWVNLVFSLLTVLVFLTICFDAKTVHLMLLAAATVVINMVCELLTLFFTTIVFGDDIATIIENHIYNVAFAAISMLIFFIIAWTVRAITNTYRQKHRAIYLASNARVLALLIMTVILGYFIMYSVQQQSDRTLSLMGLVIFILLIVLDVAMLFGTERDYRKFEAQSNLEAMKLQEELNTQIIKQQQNTLNQLYSQSHDYRNQLLYLEDVIYCHRTMRELDEAERYVSQLLDNLDSGRNHQFIGIQSLALQAILSMTAAECVKNSILFEVNITFSAFDFMKYQDICSFFANALDNAVYATRSSVIQEKSIAVHIHKQENLALIRISNTISVPVQRVTKGFISLKDPTTFRLGIGTKNMQRCIEAYGGHLEMKPDGNEFLVKANVPLPDDHDVTA